MATSITYYAWLLRHVHCFLRLDLLTARERRQADKGCEPIADGNPAQQNACTEDRSAENTKAAHSAGHALLLFPLSTLSLIAGER